MAAPTYLLVSYRTVIILRYTALWVTNIFIAPAGWTFRFPRRVPIGSRVFQPFVSVGHPTIAAPSGHPRSGRFDVLKGNR
jgi:hypothetical protein